MSEANQNPQKSARDRVQAEIDKWDKKADERCRKNGRAVATAAIGGSLITILSAWSAAIAILEGPRWARAALAVLTALCAAAIALAAALDGRHRYEAGWARARSFCDQMRAELDAYDLGAARYEGRGEREAAATLLAVMADRIAAARELPGAAPR